MRQLSLQPNFRMQNPARNTSINLFTLHNKGFLRISNRIIIKNNKLSLNYFITSTSSNNLNSSATILTAGTTLTAKVVLAHLVPLILLANFVELLYKNQNNLDSNVRYGITQPIGTPTAHKKKFQKEFFRPTATFKQKNFIKKIKQKSTLSEINIYSDFLFYQGIIVMWSNKIYFIVLRLLVAVPVCQIVDKLVIFLIQWNIYQNQTIELGILGVRIILILVLITKITNFLIEIIKYINFIIIMILFLIINFLKKIQNGIAKRPRIRFVLF